MHSKLEIINPLNYPAWDDLLLPNEKYSFFQTSFWAHLLEATYSYKPFYFTVVVDQKLIFLRPVIEVRSIFTGRRIVSLPSGNFCEPVVNEVTGNDIFFKYRWILEELQGGIHLNYG